MSLRLHHLPIRDAALPTLASWLLAERPDPRPETLASALVLLPSSRACAQLGHALLEAAATDALLLPRILTPARLADHLAELLDLVDDTLPDPMLRPLILAPRLAEVDWLAERPEAAAGLAAELVQLFDEVRLARRDAWILDGVDDDALLRLAGPDAVGILESDLGRIRQAWRLYRQVLPRDQIDQRVAALTAAAAGWPGAVPSMVAAAHFSRLDEVAAAAVRGLAAQGAPTHWLSPDASDPRSRLLLASYRDAERPSHPLAGVRALARRVTEELPPAPRFAADRFQARIAELGAAGEELAPGGSFRLLACGDPEHESRVVAAEVCEALAAADPAPEIVVATPDRDLAARIAAHLRDAGVDVDDTRGRPLAGLPAGRLVRDLLQVVVKGWPYGPLFELLGHPYVRLVEDGVRPGHAVRVQLLEAAARGRGAAGRGLAALRKAAEADDARAGDRRRDWSLAELVDDLKLKTAPLTDLAAGPATWAGAVQALQRVWQGLAPGRPLDGAPDPRHDHDDVGALAGLLGALLAAAARLPEASLADIAAAIDGLLCDPAHEVRPHRQRHLPVRLVGLVEARLERVDHLVLAGLAQDVFPGRLARPLFLSDRVRRELDLEHWRARAGRDGELFLRLLHGAPRVTMTWPAERDAQPSLPSPLVQRLLLVKPDAAMPLPEPELYRREAVEVAELSRTEKAFVAEPEPVPAPDVRRPDRLSHTSLQRYRDCPYRFLLADALGLRRPDPLEAAFTAADHGTLAHGIMQAWLKPGDAGARALAAGDPVVARAAFDVAAEKGLEDHGRTLPGAYVALRSLLALAPDLVALELERFRTWRPVALEADFTVTLGQAADWLQSVGVAPPEVPDSRRDVILHGGIDRVDRRLDGLAAAVIDYKTGTMPSAKRVGDGRELQVHLYGLAVAAGQVVGLADNLPIDHGGYYGLRNDTLGLPARPHLAGTETLAAGVEAIIATALRILDPAEPFALVPDWRDDATPGNLPCQTCDFRGICRLEERDATPALAARVAALLTANRGAGA